MPFGRIFRGPAPVLGDHLCHSAAYSWAGAGRLDEDCTEKQPAALICSDSAELDPAPGVREIMDIEHVVHAQRGGREAVASLAVAAGDGLHAVSAWNPR